MQVTRVLVSLLLLLAVVHCDYWQQTVGIQYFNLPTTSLGNFEGSYTSNSRLGFGLSICQDNTTIFGSFDQLGIFNGVVSASNIANGTWYQAGNTSCVTGKFQLTLTTEGFTGYYQCGSAPTKYNWTETKLNPFRPAPLLCAYMNFTSGLTLSGRFVDSVGLAKDFCYDTANKLSNASLSYLYTANDATVQKGFFSGTSYSKGQIFLGTWFELAPAAGADLYYLDASGNVQGYFWTGLNGTNGSTVINPAEYNQPTQHAARGPFTGPVGLTSSPTCNDYASIRTKVLNNLVAVVDDDNLYFVSSGFNVPYDDDDGAVDDDLFNSSSLLSPLTLLLPLLLLALLF